MSYELRPLSLAEILDAAFRLVQTEWKTLIGLSLIMQIPLVLLALAVPWMFDPLAQPFAAGDEVTAENLVEMAAGIGFALRTLRSGIRFTPLISAIGGAVAVVAGVLLALEPLGLLLSA